MNRPLLHAARRAVAAAAHIYRGHPAAAARCAALAGRLDGPLRVAVAGRVKAGKSTLLNALIGERLAPSDVAERTKVVTWYRASAEHRITLELRDGQQRVLPVRRCDDGLDIDLGATTADDVERLVVDWPSPDLRAWTVIDTPGVASLSTDVSSRATRLFDPEEGSDEGADAVVYLMRHVHAADVEFLRGLRGARTPSVNVVAVLSRADEIGSARPDAMAAAAAVAGRYRGDHTLRGLCLDVVPVAGLLAETGRSLESEEVATLRTLAATPHDGLYEMLRSADRFLADASADLTRKQRHHLLERFGLFGLRLAARLVTEASEQGELGRELVRHSGLVELQSSLATRLQARSDVLVARSVLQGLRRLLRDEPAPGTAALAVDVGRTLRGAHELVELRALAALRAGEVALPPEALAEGLALLGDLGPAARSRLGLPPDCSDRECRSRAAQAVHRWRAWGENPVADQAATDLCRTVVRTCEGIASGAGLTRAAARRTS